MERKTIYYITQLEGGGRGGAVFAGGLERKVCSTVFRDYEKNMVGKRHFQH